MHMGWNPFERPKKTVMDTAQKEDKKIELDLDKGPVVAPGGAILSQGDSQEEIKRKMRQQAEDMREAA